MLGGSARPGAPSRRAVPTLHFSPMVRPRCLVPCALVATALAGCVAPPLARPPDTVTTSPGRVAPPGPSPEPPPTAESLPARDPSVGCAHIGRRPALPRSESCCGAPGKLYYRADGAEGVFFESSATCERLESMAQVLARMSAQADAARSEEGEARWRALSEDLRVRSADATACVEERCPLEPSSQPPRRRTMPLPVHVSASHPATPSTRRDP